MNAMRTKSVTMVTSFKKKCSCHIIFFLFIRIISQIFYIFAYILTIKPI